MAQSRELCQTCPLNERKPLDKREACALLAADIIHSWWHNDPTLELDDVAFDMLQYHTPRLDEDDENRINGCMVEHSSDRCRNMNPYGGV